MRFTLQTKTRGELSFFMPDDGGYVRLESDKRHGTLAEQICEGGSVGYGQTISATPETMERVCRAWWRSHCNRNRSPSN